MSWTVTQTVMQTVMQTVTQTVMQTVTIQPLVLTLSNRNSKVKIKKHLSSFLTIQMDVKLNGIQLHTDVSLVTGALETALLGVS